MTDGKQGVPFLTSVTFRPPRPEKGREAEAAIRAFFEREIRTLEAIAPSYEVTVARRRNHWRLTVEPHYTTLGVACPTGVFLPLCTALEPLLGGQVECESKPQR